MEQFIVTWIIVFTTSIQVVLSLQPMLVTVTGKMLGIESLVNGKLIHSYKGVPYAEPPTGQRRFMKPIPLMPMPGAFNATRSSPVCPRQSQFELYMNEDCLHLNLWIPASSGHSKRMNYPIVIYVPSNDESRFPDGSEFAADNSVIFVSINYRTGAFGYLFSASQEAPGNAGLYDIVEAIRWVKVNSRLFDGDPEDITLWGKAEGAAAAAILMTSPLTTNILRKMIYESGKLHTSVNSFRRNSEAVTMRLLVNAGCYNYGIPWEVQREKAIRCLKTVHPEVIVG